MSFLLHAPPRNAIVWVESCINYTLDLPKGTFRYFNHGCMTHKGTQSYGTCCLILLTNTFHSPIKRGLHLSCQSRPSRVFYFNYTIQLKKNRRILVRLSLGVSGYDIYKARLSSRQWHDWWGADAMKEAIAMWKQCLVHFDLFIIRFESEAAGSARRAEVEVDCSLDALCSESTWHIKPEWRPLTLRGRTVTSISAVVLIVPGKCWRYWQQRVVDQ